MSQFEDNSKPKYEEDNQNIDKVKDSVIYKSNKLKDKQEHSKETTMTKWSTDKIVAVGLVTMGMMSISGYIAYALYTGNSNGSEIPMAIVSGLTGFLGRGALPHEEYPNKYGCPPPKH